MIGRRIFLAAAAACAQPLRTMAGQTAWSPQRDLQIIAPSEPASGFDVVARVLQRVWQQAHMLTIPVSVINKPGGGGSLGWSYLHQHAGSGVYLGIISDLLISNHLAGLSPLEYTDVTPLAILQRNEIVVFVNAASPIASGHDLIERLQRDPTSVSVAMSGVGGQNEIALGLILKSAAVDIRKLRVVGFSGSAAALVAVVGGHVDLLLAPASSAAGQVQAGKLRGLGIAASARMGGPMSDIPTWREQGIDVVFSNWRGVAGPPGMTPAMIDYWNGILARTVRDPIWLAALAAEQLSDFYLDSAAASQFLATQNDETRGVLQELGLARTTG